MKKAKCMIILLILPVIILLTGCIKIDIDTGIDADFTAFLSYHIELDTGELDHQYQSILKNALNRIGWHYQEELGFIVELDVDTDTNVLIMTRRVANNNFEQAFDSLEAMLTDEDMTVFMQVDMVYQSFERQNRYLINALTDIPQIMRLSNAEDLSPALQQELDDAIRAGTGTITLTVPASEIVNTSHNVSLQNNLAVMSIPLRFTGQTGFELEGVINLLRDGAPGGSLNEIIREQTMMRDLIMIGCGAIIVILLIILLIISLTKKKPRY